MKYGMIMLFFLGACAADEKDFDNMAKDICHCMTDSTLTDRNACMDEFSKKYEKLNSYDSDVEFQNKLVESMRKVKGCEQYAAFYENSLGE